MIKQSSNFMDYSRVDQKTREKMDELFRTPKKNYWLRKRAFDIVFSLLAVILLSPFLILISLLVVLGDPHGGPFYKQKRIGRHGDEFYMYKFRSMVVNAEALQKELMDRNEADGPAFKIKDDPRITPVGRVLRKFSLDELPQFFNVLKGDMSVVGPRPPLPKEVEQFDDYQKLKLVVTPGLTSIWQTTPSRNDVPFDEWIEMDINYIKTRTVFLDLKLIFKTVILMLNKDGC
ncbi:MAG: sugar transferase [Abditibacteriota bacterium]|nr:sugar transferase [Abditibacteriota bacterium]